MPGRFNEILAGRFNRGLQKLFAMKGGPPTPQLASDITPTIQTENMMALENRILGSWRSFAYVKILAAGGAGTFGQVRLRNPATSNAIAVLEKVTISNATGADTPFITRGPTGTGDLATTDAANNSIRDLRMGPISGVIISSFATPAAPVGVTWWAGATVAAFSQIEAILLPSQEFVIAPGDLITVNSNVANTGLRVSMMWRERGLEAEEVQALA
jgi:hypothetical protein